MSYQHLRPKQEKALHDLRRYVSLGGRRVVVQAPTGFGKTRLSAAIVEGAMRKNRRSIFIVPALSLIDQTVEMFNRNDIRDIGVIQANHPLTDPTRPVQIASIDTLKRRDTFPHDVCMIDEVHRWHEWYDTLLGREEWADVPVIGLSATPWAKGLGLRFDKLIIAATTAELIEDGLLSTFRTYAPSYPNMKGTAVTAGDYQSTAAEAKMGPLTGHIVNTWREKAMGRPTFLFAVNRAHARHLQEEFDKAGVTTGYIDAYTSTEDRLVIRDQFHAGRIEVVCNVGCLTTGVDWDVRCIVMARPTKSEMLWVQMIGRGLRLADGKDHLLILDHSTNSQRLGFVTDIHHEQLDRSKRGERSSEYKPNEKLPKRCTSCGFMKPEGVHECPSCGFAPVRREAVRTRDGHLEEMHSSVNLQDWYSQLLTIALARDYKQGWVNHKFKEKFGHWPPDRLKNLPKPVSPEVTSWVTSRQIAWAKSRRRSA